MYICTNTPMYNVKLVDYHYEEKYSVTINTVIGYKLFQIV